ncbi:hypothetical protein K461DRAFT_265042 [Myriangium duriaei CBS 260.36]|uniref:Uncharacterized protein n=1 Tax=Myriangium duriaei CBS 260.36 TaxID=1168546 RepID=A0A9P4JAF7_9PEZI|nr:hypothetical protein K461DRAFT_265042 [Myriangium duriaei CBS 260.36]
MLNPVNILFLTILFYTLSSLAANVKYSLSYMDPQQGILRRMHRDGHIDAWNINKVVRNMRMWSIDKYYAEKRGLDLYVTNRIALSGPEDLNDEFQQMAVIIRDRV